jgi:intracellular sulfur oxidation DsrE/DsrF family protein
MNWLLRFCIATCLFAGAGLAAAQDKVVYHFDSGLPQATKGLRNVGNHLDVDPKAKIVVVAHADGVDFLMNGAQDRNGNPYNVTVELLRERGVEFQVCEITLRNRKLEKKQFIPDVVFVPSGVQQITRLQQRDGYAYLKP